MVLGGGICLGIGIGGNLFTQNAVMTSYMPALRTSDTKNLQLFNFFFSF